MKALIAILMTVLLGACSSVTTQPRTNTASEKQRRATPFLDVADYTNYIQGVLIEGTLNLWAGMEASGPTEAAVREVFEHADIPLAGEPLKTLAAPTQVLGWQLPGNAGAAAGLICALLRNGYGVAEAARLEFHYVE